MAAKFLFLLACLFPTVLGFFCPDNVTQCTTDESTCCELVGGSFGCCPIPDAVCCSDRQNCCPAGFRCLTGGLCTRGIDDNIPTDEHARQITTSEGGSSCLSDETQECLSDRFTCCQTMGERQTSCCPMRDAVCCRDGLHCCPKGTSCHLENGLCLPEVKTAPSISDRPCSANYSCPDDDTCCEMSGGLWGCCPLPEAVCCPDKVHCCPRGYNCGPTGCQQAPSRSLWTKLQDIICPGGTYKCPDQTTCCQLPNLSWGCCPIPDAVCCSDRVHCCPSGYTCSGTTQVCYRAEPGQEPVTLPWFSHKIAATEIAYEIPFSNIQSERAL